MRVEATKELLAPLDDVWALLAEPYHLSDWWPEVASVRPDQRGFAEGARWELIGGPQPTLLRRAHHRSLAVVKRIEPRRSVRWLLVKDRLELEVRVRAASDSTTEVTVAVEGRWRPELFGQPRRNVRAAASRLYDLCQTAAALRAADSD